MLNKLSPFFAIIFSFLLLKEKIKPAQAMCVILAFVGCLFVVKPGFENAHLIPALIGVCGGLGAGIAYTMVRKMGTHGVKGPVIVFYFSFLRDCLQREDSLRSPQHIPMHPPEKFLFLIIHRLFLQHYLDFFYLRRFRIDTV